MFSLVISHIFYRVPNSYGLLLKLRPNGSAGHISVKMTFLGGNNRPSEQTEGRLKHGETEIFVDQIKQMGLEEEMRQLAEANNMEENRFERRHS